MGSDKEDLNNFHEFLPGGAYRAVDRLHELIPSGSEPKCIRRDVVIAIDVYIAQTGFDTDRYQKVSRIAEQCILQIVEATKARDWDITDHLISIGQRYADLAYDMKKPVYDHVIAQGFSKLALTQ